MMFGHLDITVALCHDVRVRTTLTIEDDLLTVAKILAAEKSESVGKAISDLARLGLSATTRAKGRTKSGFPVFSVPKGAHTITIEDIRKFEDEA
jgi:hypothetical protein